MGFMKRSIILLGVVFCLTLLVWQGKVYADAASRVSWESQIDFEEQQFEHAREVFGLMANAVQSALDDCNEGDFSFWIKNFEGFLETLQKAEKHVFDIPAISKIGTEAWKSEWDRKDALIFKYVELEDGVKARIKDFKERFQRECIEWPDTEPPQRVPTDASAGPVDEIIDRTPPEVPQNTADEYAKCVASCKPILEKIKPLKERLRELKNKQGNLAKWKNEFKRLKNLYERSAEKARQRRYTASDGKEHWGRIEFDKQYRVNGYTPASGTDRVDPAIQRYLDMIKQNMARLEAKIREASLSDDKTRQDRIRRTEEEIAEIQKEYNDCVRDCNKKYGGKKDEIVAGVNIVDLISRTGSRTDTSRGSQPPPPQGDASSGGQAAPVPQRDAATGEGSMPIGGPVPLTDTEGFDKVPPGDTSNYETGVGVPGTEEVQYVDLKGDRAKCDTATLYKPTLQGMDVTAATVVTGKGADFRKWKVDDVRMNLDGEVIKPDKEEDFYIEKDSYYRGAATVTFAAIGSQYKRHADKAQSGGVCPVTGQKKEVSDRKDTIHDGIDRAGMAAGMGLLASQARGSIPAKKVTFKLDKKQAKKIIDKKIFFILCFFPYRDIFFLSRIV